LTESTLGEETLPIMHRTII